MGLVSPDEPNRRQSDNIPDRRAFRDNLQPLSLLIGPGLYGAALRMNPLLLRRCYRGQVKSLYQCRESVGFNAVHVTLCGENSGS